MIGFSVDHFITYNYKRSGARFYHKVYEFRYLVTVASSGLDTGGDAYQCLSSQLHIKSCNRAIFKSSMHLGECRSMAPAAAPHFHCGKGERTYSEPTHECRAAKRTEMARSLAARVDCYLPSSHRTSPSSQEGESSNLMHHLSACTAHPYNVEKAFTCSCSP
eukprot:1659959-Pleurochrysis_carterae.AAC.1